MKASDFKDLLIRSLEESADPAESFSRISEAGVAYDFSEGFSDKVLAELEVGRSAVVREVEFVRSLNYIFKRVALTGVAAIVLLLISIFLMEGSLSFNSFLGMSDAYDESIVCLLTGI